MRYLILVILTVLVTEFAPGPAIGGEPSAAHLAGLRRTLELRKQRRRSLSPNPVGVIVPYPMPPVLIIRETPDAHREIEALLGALRSSR